ncbi:RagB/SusD family nutrient uptake outer membrane protein [Parabacteroides hominis]|uniref:RagB/SusD family nutrient uptake outer membrane protein n=1 Tax=Parabacteroides hominis TaxID=2763057 RepID=A0ABR7DMM5_9BACT|nr:RagB/SusD family nutrient uptake outer membrane protein [Parabacteroides hominis]MBC5632315.1 RagB/SusD family nutrient uptake outer membrane protein [Parabacteroides hominis]
MKRTVFIFIVGLVLMACTDQLEQYPQDKISPQTYFRNENDLRLYTNSFYNILPGAVGIFSEKVDNIVSNTLADELTGQRTVPTSGGGWDWGTLRNINFYLENSVKCDDENVRARYDGVARFFRAYYYFNMVKRFGDVPWYDKVISDKDTEALQKKRDTRTLVIDNMIKDLDFAIEHLPADRTVDQVSKWTALALKSRICLYEGTFRKYHTELAVSGWESMLDLAIEASEQLMKGSGYALYNTGNPGKDYLNLFASIDPIETEVILARLYSDALQIYHYVNYYLTSPGQGRNGLEKRLVNSYLMLDGNRFTDIPGYEKMTFVDEVKNRDPRLSQTIRTPGYTRIGETTRLVPDFSLCMTGYQIIKYLTSPKYDQYDRSCNAMPLMRYAEILLNYAEAKAERGTITQEDLDKSINLIRSRAGMPGLNLVNANADPDSYIAKLYPAVCGENKGVILEIRRERRIELVMESFRWDDVMRWKEASACFLEPFKGMYFPATGSYDLDDDGKFDICIYKDEKPNAGDIQYYKLGVDIILESGESGNVMVNPHIQKIWDEDKDYFYPIPIQERLLNPNLTQNPGWDDGID